LVRGRAENSVVEQLRMRPKPLAVFGPRCSRYQAFPTTNPSMTERSKYQQNIIRNYYQNRDAIALQRAQELITELYLSEGKKRQKHWDSMVGHLQKLGVKDDVIAHLRKQDDPQLVAQIIQKMAG
jgi:hypothetical protein